MSALTFDRVVLSGTTPTYGAADVTGDLAPANDRGFIHVKNGSASAVTVTLATPGTTRFGVDEPDVTISVPAAGERLIGPLDSSLVNSTDKAVRVSYSSVTSVTRAALFI